MNLLNIGCGSHHHPNWTNLDKQGGDGIIEHDVYDGLPFEDETFDAVYHSDLIEHLYKRFAPLFMRECWRVLKVGGVVRVATPDLEEIVRQYLLNLQLVRRGKSDMANERYEWTVIELLDQLCRHRSGGEMLEYWKQDPMPVEDFVYARVGQEAYQTIQILRKNEQTPLQCAGMPLDEELDAERVGKFRLSGQAHLWMYDRYSLRLLLQDAGFKDVEQCEAHESRIPDFADYHLDMMRDGSVRKPDSIYFEGMK